MQFNSRIGFRIPISAEEKSLSEFCGGDQILYVDACNKYGCTSSEPPIYIDSLNAQKARTITNIEKIKIANVSIYPNPASDFLYVKQNSTHHKKYQVAIFNTSGQMVLRTSISREESQIPISHLPKGTYILNLEQPEDRILKAFKFIKIE